MYYEGVKEGGGGNPTHESRTLKSRNNASQGLKFRVHVSRKFSQVKEQYMTGPVQNAAVCRVNDE